MNNSTQHIIIPTLRRQWRMQELIVLMLLALAVTIPLIVLMHITLHLSWWWGLPLFAMIFALAITASSKWKLHDRDVARILNAGHPELEESAALLLRPNDQLGFLEKLQVQKITAVIQSISPVSPVLKKMRRAAIALGAATCLAILLLVAAPSLIAAGKGSTTANNADSEIAPKELVHPSVSSVQLRIQPPAYTGQSARTQQRFNIRAEQGSKISWEIITKGEAADLKLLFNDSSIISAESLNKAHGNWIAEKLLKANGYYQLKINNEVSELYQLEIIPDQLPVVTVQTPRPSTVIEFGQSQQVPLAVSLTDDYGILSADIFTTIASGNGEAVKFKEQKLAFNKFSVGSKQYQLAKTFDLPGMGMRPGDELYFYISARDNNQQETRSDIYTIRIEDTAVLMSMDGMMSGVDVKPEFFRSQRQIIIETEALLKGRDTMSREAFNNRSNELGIDQKLLRLRYGKFLGEESETNIGEDGHAEHGDKHGEKDGVKGGEKHEDKDGHTEEVAIEDFNNAEKIIDRFSHKHDIAEDATFFDPQTKKELRATLAEMWKAELQLRTYKVSDALPFEYKALRLLKELQQKSREYVPKTSGKTTPLKPEKRLTGELDKIIETRSKQIYQAPADKLVMLRKALAILNNSQDEQQPGSKTGTWQSFSASEKEILELATGELSLRASADPAAYLRAFEAAGKLIRNDYTETQLIEKAIQKILQAVNSLPAATVSGNDMNLSRDYFMNLNKPARRS